MPQMAETVNCATFDKTIRMKHLILLLTLFAFTAPSFAQGYRTNNQTNNKTEKSRSKEVYGKNILSVSPMQLTAIGSDEDAPDLSVGLAFEHIMDNNLISFRLPLSFSLNESYVYFMPTIKLYPTRQGQVRYALGPQFLIGYGNDHYTQTTYDPSTSYTTQKRISIDRRQFGFMINNSANFTLMKSLYAGVDASLGIIYYDNEPKNTYNTIGITPLSDNSNVQPAFHLNFCMGYRF